MTPPTPGLVAVVGSANLDVVVTVDRFPAPGETVFGGDILEVAGGKGLNQATAAARTARSALVACVGEDDAGGSLVAWLEAARVDSRHVHRVATPTGRAFIQVDPAGENSIVVAAAANARLTPADVLGALENLGPAVVLAQLEVSLEAVATAAEWALEHAARFVLNASPVQHLPGELLAVCDPLVVNAPEAALLLGDDSAPDLTRVAGRLLGLARSVVVTDGPRGAYVADSSGVEHVRGVRVNAVDTTGAGDEFVGRLSASLAAGEALAEAVAGANRAAALVVAVPRDQR